MQLAVWLKRNNKTPTDLATQIGCSVSTITRLLPADGKKQMRRPSLDLASRIAEATGGAVTANDFMAAAIAAEDEPPPAARLVVGGVR